MSSPKVASPVSAMISGRLIIILSILLDTILLGVWLGLIWLLDWLTSRIPNEGHLEWATAKWVLGIATLLLIVIFLYWDLRGTYSNFRRHYDEQQGLALANIDTQRAIQQGTTNYPYPATTPEGENAAPTS